MPRHYNGVIILGQGLILLMILMALPVYLKNKLEKVNYKPLAFSVRIITDLWLHNFYRVVSFCFRFCLFLFIFFFCNTANYTYMEHQRYFFSVCVFYSTNQWFAATNTEFSVSSIRCSHSILSPLFLNLMKLKYSLLCDTLLNLQ